MTAVSQTIPNLIGGISQQPQDIRPLNTADLLSNVWLSASSGLSTRPELKYVGKYVSAPLSSRSGIQHSISKPSGNYQVTVVDGVLSVMDTQNGQLQQIAIQGNAGAYLSAGGNDENLGFVTVGDTTFIYNRSVVTSATMNPEGSVSTGNTDGGVVRRNPNLHSTFWVKQRTTATDLLATYYNASKIDQVNYDRDVKDTVDDLGDNNFPLAPNPQTRPVSGQNYRASNSIVSYVLQLETDYMASDDSAGNVRAVLFNDSVDEFSDLPPSDREGRLVLISQDVGESVDDYWVWYRDGGWEETYGWDSFEQPDSATMPVILVDNLNGTWTLRETAWPGRQSGDTDSNPTPSFLGKPINSMFIHKNRMCILSGENFLASRVADFENFYRSTCSQLLDDDPIDVASPQSRGADLSHAVPFESSLRLFSELDVFSLLTDADDLLSPNTAKIAYVNEYQAAPEVTPITMAANIGFVSSQKSKRYADMLEYQIERTFGKETALPITDSVPELIPSGVYRASHSPSDNLVILLSHGAPRSAFVYHYYYNAQGKVMSSWTQWEFPGVVHDANFEADRLMVLLEVGSELIQTSMVFNTVLGSKVVDDAVLLDLKVPSSDLTITLSGSDTLITLPYTPDPTDVRLVVSPEFTSGPVPEGEMLIPDSIAGSVLTFENVDLTTTNFFVGQLYEVRWRLNKFFVRDEEGVAIRDGRLQMRHLVFNYSHSGPFSVDVKTEHRDPITSSFSGTYLGSSNNILGQVNLEEGAFKIPVKGAGDAVEVEVVAKSALRVRFTALEWFGSYRPKRRKV